MINNKILGLIGLSAKAGKICFGADRVESEIKRRKVYLVIIAKDSSERTKEKFQNICKNEGIKSIVIENIESLSKAIGKTNKAVIGIKDKNLATEIQKIYDGGDLIG